MATTVDEFGNVIEVPTGTEQTNQQNRSYISSGGIDDDSGSIQRFDDGSSIQTFDDGSQLITDSEGGISNTPATEYVNAGTTVSGKSGTSASKTSKPKPGKRWQNPLGNFSSYTYQISLYMITPDAYDAFIQSGRKNINAFQDVSNTGNGVFLVAQSGGINNTASKRAPGFDQDFFIDDLKIKQAINGKDTQAATNTTNLSFSITEPYGFSFITRLKRAADELAKVTRSKNYKDLTNPTRQFFIIGIRFQGYDLNGNLINSKDIPGTDGDPQGNAYGIYERFFDISITGMKFKIENKAVTYHITAASVASGSAFGVKRGIIWQGAKVVANNVYNALKGDDNVYQGLLTKMNKDQQKLYDEKSIKIPNVWDVKFLGDASSTIELASIVNPDDIEKSRMPMANINNTSQVNVSTEAKSTPETTAKEISVPGGTPILQAVNQIILQSEFLTKALKKVYTSDPAPDPKTGDDELVNDSKNQIKWYTMTAEIKNLGWDTQVGDFAYKTTYVIQTYETPVVLSAYAKKAAKYYGPHKRYDYWFTGKNSEILRYEQTMDNTFFNVALAPSGDASSQGGATDQPTTVAPQDQPSQGALNVGLEAQNSYMTSLFDPGAYATAKIQILGDPDFLMQPSPSSINALYNKFYGTDGFTINPNGGQVFIEINFKEPIDYKNKDGLLSINESILFWKYPADITADIKKRGGGISYMVLSCASTFNKGKFEQELVCVINTFDNPNGSTNSPTDANGAANEREDAAKADAEYNNRSGTTGTASSTNGAGTSNSDSNTAVDDYYGAGPSDDGFNSYNSTLPTDQQTVPDKNGPVQDDDASKQTENPAEWYDDGGREDVVDSFGGGRGP
jgi:hypothetical protein